MSSLNNHMNKLSEFAFNGKLEELRNLLSNETMMSSDTKILSALHSAIEGENIECIKAIVEYGVDIEAIFGNTTALEHSVDMAIDGSIQNSTGIEEESYELIKYFLSIGSNPLPGLELAKKHKNNEVVNFINHYAKSD